MCYQIYAKYPEQILANSVDPDPTDPLGAFWTGSTLSFYQYFLTYQRAITNFSTHIFGSYCTIIDK